MFSKTEKVNTRTGWELGILFILTKCHILFINVRHLI